VPNLGVLGQHQRLQKQRKRAKGRTLAN
jgi:hypothetical protein